MKAATTAWLGFALAMPGCGEADYTCSGDVFESQPEALVAIESAELTGQVMLSAQSPVEHAAFDVSLTGLPRVWTPNNTSLLSPWLYVSTEVSYASEQPVGAELPPVRILLDNGAETASGVSGTSGAGLGPGVAHGAVTLALFQVCEFDSDSTDCCPFGSEGCEGHLDLNLERDSDLFPAVVVSYRVQARAKVYDCTRETPNASLTLEEGS